MQWLKRDLGVSYFDKVSLSSPWLYGFACFHSRSNIFSAIFISNNREHHFEKQPDDLPSDAFIIANTFLYFIQLIITFIPVKVCRLIERIMTSLLLAPSDMELLPNPYGKNPGQPKVSFKEAPFRTAFFRFRHACYALLILPTSLTVAVINFIFRPIDSLISAWRYITETRQETFERRESQYTSAFGQSMMCPINTASVKDNFSGMARLVPKQREEIFSSYRIGFRDVYDARTFLLSEHAEQTLSEDERIALFTPLLSDFTAEDKFNVLRNSGFLSYFDSEEWLEPLLAGIDTARRVALISWRTMKATQLLSCPRLIFKDIPVEQRYQMLLRLNPIERPQEDILMEAIISSEQPQFLIFELFNGMSNDQIKTLLTQADKRWAKLLLLCDQALTEPVVQYFRDNISPAERKRLKKSYDYWHTAPYRGLSNLALGIVKQTVNRNDYTDIELFGYDRYFAVSVRELMLTGLLNDASVEELNKILFPWIRHLSGDENREARIAALTYYRLEDPLMRYAMEHHLTAWRDWLLMQGVPVPAQFRENGNVIAGGQAIHEESVHKTVADSLNALKKHFRPSQEQIDDSVAQLNAYAASVLPASETDNEDYKAIAFRALKRLTGDEYRKYAETHSRVSIETQLAFFWKCFSALPTALQDEAWTIFCTKLEMIQRGGNEGAKGDDSRICVGGTHNQLSLALQIVAPDLIWVEFMNQKMLIIKALLAIRDTYLQKAWNKISANPLQDITERKLMPNALWAEIKKDKHFKDELKAHMYNKKLGRWSVADPDKMVESVLKVLNTVTPENETHIMCGEMLGPIKQITDKIEELRSEGTKKSSFTLYDRSPASSSDNKTIHPVPAPINTL